MISFSFEDASIFKLNKPILCSTESFIDASPLKDAIVDEKNRIVDATFVEMDAISRNDCEYTSEDVMRSIKASVMWQENLRNNCLFSELNHPDRNCPMARFMKIDDTRICGKILNTRKEGNFLKGNFQFLEPLGPTVWSWIESGSNIGWSLRFYTPNYVKKTRPNGKPYVQKVFPMYPVTIDTIAGPTGYKNCRIVDPDRMVIGDSTFNKTSEGWRCTESWEVLDVQNQIKQALKSDKDSAAIEDALGIDMLGGKRYVVRDHGQKVAMSLEDGRDIEFHVNSFVFNEIMNAKRS